MTLFLRYKDLEGGSPWEEKKKKSLRYEEDSLVCPHKFGIRIAIIRIHKTEFRPHFPF